MRALRCVLGVLALVLGGPVQASLNPSAWGVSAMEKVRPNTAPGSSPRVQLFAARNEFVSFQVGLYGGETGWSGVRASLPALEGPSRIEGKNLVLYRETLLSITKPTTPYTEVGEWPDGLVPDVDETVGEHRQAFPMDVPARESRALWVDVLVPMDAPPGEYHGTVEVVGGGYFARVDVSLTVVDWVMPSTPSLRTNFLVWTPAVCQAFTGQRECAREDLLRLLSYLQKLGLEHRLTFTSRFEPHNVLDWSSFDAGWAPFLAGTEPLRLPGARMTGVLYAGPLTPESLSDFSAQAGARGWLPLTFNFVGDEPPWGLTFEEARAHATLSKQTAPEMRTMVTITSLTELEWQQMTDIIDIAAVMVNFLYKPHTPRSLSAEDRLARSEAFLRLPNRELWLYQSCMSHGCGGPTPENLPGQGWPSYMVDRPAAKARGMQWVAFLEGATGEHYYEVAMKLSTAWTDQNAFGGNGDGTLIYPGTVPMVGGTTEVPLPSMRLKLIRQGIQDYEWLKLVSDQGDRAFAMEVAREVVPAPWRVPDRGEAFEQARVRLIHRYLTLIGAEIPPSMEAFLRDIPAPPPRDVIDPVRQAQ
ncbi:hypothetical protein ACN28E_23835 [Archangium lansingense]|uniref:DUF4091 domain-containing protein n=1 Tax=Archangium lansingense TaxID=2995310 RepID=UPI003B7998D7